MCTFVYTYVKSAAEMYVYYNASFLATSFSFDINILACILSQS